MEIRKGLTPLAVTGLLLSSWSCNPSGIDRSNGEVVPPADAPPPADHVEGRGLTLAAEPEKAAYVVGEPVYLTLVLRNSGEEARRVVRRLDPLVGSVSIDVVGPGGDTTRYAPLGQVDYDAGMLASLAPGDAVANVVPVFFGANGWTFREPGRYSIVAVYSAADGRGRRESVRAEPVAVGIESAPVAAPDVGRGEEASFQAGKFLLWQQGDHLEEGRAYLRGFAERAPDAVVTEYIHAAFARSYSDSFMDYRTKTVRPPDCDRAMSHLSESRFERVGAYIRIQNAIARLRCATRRGDRAAAERHLERARTAAGDHPAYAGLLARAADIARPVDAESAD